MADVDEQVTRLRALAADARSLAERASGTDRDALLQSAQGFDWAADAMADVHLEDTSLAAQGLHPGCLPRR
jgi:hypothetical protein